MASILLPHCSDTPPQRRICYALKAENESLQRELERVRANRDALKKKLEEDDTMTCASDGSVLSKNITMQADVLLLKAELSEKEDVLLQEQKTLKNAKLCHEKEKLRLRNQVESLSRALQKSIPKTDFNHKEREVETLKEGARLYKDQMRGREREREREEYVTALEKTIDEQLMTWT